MATVQKLLASLISVSMLLPCAAVPYQAAAMEDADISYCDSENYGEVFQVDEEGESEVVEANVYKEFFVSSEGSDTNDGLSVETPFATIQKARDSAAAISNDMTGNIIINIMGGIYYQDETIAFSEKDSGKNGYKVIYRAYEGQEVSISGGTLVTGWTQHDGNIYKAELDRDSKLRSLYVNGERKNMTSRKIKTKDLYGEYSITAGEADWAWSSGTKTDGMVYSASDFPDAINPDDIEIESSTTWNSYIVCVDEITAGENEGERIVSMQQPGGAIAQNGASGARFKPAGTNVVRNVFEFMDKPGEFYFDKSTHTLYYYKEDDEDLETAEVIAPTGVETLIDISGSSTDSHASNIEFDGIIFEHSDWNLVNVGDSYFKSSPQGSNSLMVFSDKWHDSKYTILDTFPGIIMLNSCDHISISNSQIRHTGAEGIVMDNDAVDCSIIGNVFEDIAGSAVDVGNPQHLYIGDGGENEKYQPGVEGACTRITISNNFMFDQAVMFPGHAGVTVYFSDTLTFTHNIIKNTPYNGINLGWGWWNFDGSAKSVLPGNPTTVCRNNNISYNMFIDTMQTLSDAGAIYTLGSMPDSVIKGNYITGIPSGEKRYGVHQDEGSAYLDISDNVIDTSLYSCDSVHVGTWGLQHDLKYTNNYATLGTYYDTDVPNSVFEPMKTYSDAFWPDEAYEIILNSGLEPEYQKIIDTDIISLADILFPADIKTNADEINIRSAGSDEYTVWLAPYDTTVFSEGSTMTKATGTDTRIKTPMQGGKYRLFVLDSSGNMVSMSSSILDNTEEFPVEIKGINTEMNENDKLFCRSVTLASDLADIPKSICYVAFYAKDGTLTGVASTDVSAANTKELVEVAVNKEFPNNTDYAKVMLWSSDDAMKPVAEAYLYNEIERYLIENEDFSEYYLKKGDDLTVNTNSRWSTAPGSAPEQVFVYGKDNDSEPGYAVIGHGNGGNTFFFGCRNDDYAIENGKVYLKADVRVVSGKAAMYLQAKGTFNSFPDSISVSIDPSSNSVTYGGTVINNVGLSTGKWYTVEYTLDMKNKTNSVSVTDIAEKKIIAEGTNGVSSVPENIASLVFRKEGSGYEINATNITMAKFREDLPRMLFATEFSVTDESGNSIPNALISVDGDEIHTDTNGNAKAYLANGTYRYTVAAYGYEASEGEVTVDKSEQTVQVKLKNSTAVKQNVSFSITNSEGTSLDGCDIQVTNTDYGLSIAPAGNGIYMLESGEYSYKIEKAGYMPYTGQLNVENDSINQSIVMSKAYLREDFENITGDWGMTQTGRKCPITISDGMLKLELNSNDLDNTTVSTKSFSDIGIPTTGKIAIDFDWEPVIEAGKGRYSILEFLGSGGEFIFGLYQNGGSGLYYVSKDTLGDKDNNGIKFSDYKDAVYHISAVLDLGSGSVELVVMNGETVMVNERLNTTASDLASMSARAIYSLTYMNIDNFEIYEYID